MGFCLSARDPTTSLSQLLVILLVTVSFCMVEGLGGSREGGQREFDYFALALQWPGTYCQRTRHCCSSNACCRRSNAPTEFTIHGLWPDYNDGTWPSCCRGTSFDEKEISSLKGALAKYWPSLSCGSSSTCQGTRGSFWAHEWEKHGTCAFPVIRDEYSYFLTTINLFSKYNISRVLFEEGYVPSNTEKYPLGGIVSSIENAFHTTPKVSCSKVAVEELQICFYKDFKPRDCVIRLETEGYLNSSSSCPKYVSLPTYVSLGLNDANTTTSWVPENEAF